MRNNRSPSFQNQYSHSPSPATKKYYTRDQVSVIIKATLQSKLSKIYKQLQQKQQIIKHLNQRLNRNDQALQHYSTKSNEFMKYYDSDMKQITMETVNRLISDKLQYFWNTSEKQIQKIRQGYAQKSRSFQHTCEQRMNQKFSQIRQQCQNSIDVFKKKNNAYWNKVKQTLGKIHNRVTANQQKTNNIGKQLMKYENDRNINKKMLKQIEKGITSAKMLVQLKKSVNNVYKNFEQVLKLQDVLRDQYFNKVNNTQHSICYKCSQKTPFYNPQNNNFQHKKSTINNNTQDFVVLQYSIQQEENKRKSLNCDPYQFGLTEPLRKQSYSLHKNPPKNIKIPSRPTSTHKQSINYENDSNQKDFFQSKDNYYTDYQMGSPVTNKSSNINQSRQIGNKKKMIKNSFQEGVSADSFQFNYTANNNSTALYQSSQVNSFMNFTLESRKQPVQNIKSRLQELISVKSYLTPLKVSIDHINYLKNSDGNYLFDLKGNMFKVSPHDFQELQHLGLLKKIQEVKKKN